MSESSNGPEESERGVADDIDLKMLNAKRMIELRKRLKSEIAKKSLEEQRAEKLRNQPTDRDVLSKALRDRGDEVLASAESSYPREMRIMIPQLATLVRQGKVTTITGGELLQFLRSIGMRVSVSTTISVEDHGKFVSLADKLKREE